MKKHILITAVALLPLCAAFFFHGLTRAQTTTTAYNPALLKILWDAPTMNEDGTPLTDLDHYDVAVSRHADNPDTSPYPVEFKSISCSDVTCGMMLFENFKELMTGASVIYVQVRAVDQAYNASDWSDQLMIPLDVVSPGVPIHLRIEIQVTASVTVTHP